MLLIISENEIQTSRRALAKAQYGHPVEWALDAGIVTESTRKIHDSMGRVCWMCGSRFAVGEPVTIVALEDIGNVICHTPCLKEACGDALEITARERKK